MHAQGGVIFYHTLGEAGNMVILFVIVFLIWTAISIFTKGPEQDNAGVPEPPLLDGLIGCSPMVWMIVIFLIISFLCWYPNQVKY